jgi:hypothetical protein
MTTLKALLYTILLIWFLLSIEALVWFARFADLGTAATKGCCAGI